MRRRVEALVAVLHDEHRLVLPVSGGDVEIRTPDGTNLAILASIFRAAPKKELQDYVASRPRGKYARRLWFLYELLTGSRLPVDDLRTGGYVSLDGKRIIINKSIPDRW